MGNDDRVSQSKTTTKEDRFGDDGYYDCLGFSPKRTTKRMILGVIFVLYSAGMIWGSAAWVRSKATSPVKVVNLTDSDILDFPSNVEEMNTMVDDWKLGKVEASLTFSCSNPDGKRRGLELPVTRSTATWVRANAPDDSGETNFWIRHAMTGIVVAQFECKDNRCRRTNAYLWDPNVCEFYGYP